MMNYANMRVQRGDLFKLLAACFYEPDKELFLQERLCENLASLFAGLHCEEPVAVAQRMKKALIESTQEELQVEHARLFVGPFELVAPPYGSVYLETAKRLMGDSTLVVQKMYQEAGLSLETKEAPDHIALELEFMHYLCFCEVDAASRGKSGEASTFAEAQAEFMHRFLGPWIPDFCKDIRNGTDNRFYSLLADCLEGFTSEMISHYGTAPFPQPEERHACRASAAQH